MNWGKRGDHMLIGYAMCGSFCTFERSLAEMSGLARAGHTLVPIMSPAAYSTDTRFGKAADIRSRVKDICKADIIYKTEDAEPLGPKVKLDILVVAPCTGNTIAKLANGISDTSVTMACKAHLRCDRPLLLCLASNDALSGNLENLARMLKRKSVYFVPLVQDDPVKKPHSLVAQFERLEEGIAAAMDGKQLRPLFI